MRQTLHIRDPQTGHTTLMMLASRLKPFLMAGHAFEVTVKPAKRTTEQNARMWAMLGDVSRQVVWHGQKLAPDEWKHVLSSSLKKQKVVPGIDGGFVVMGLSTSQMSKAEMGELMDLIEAFGAQQGVRFTTREHEPA